MPNTKIILLSTFLLLLGFRVCGQEDVFIKDIIEGIAESLPEDYDLSELTEQLSHFRKHPLNLNNTSPEELKAFTFLSALQISSFFDHLQNNGRLLDLLELQGIAGFDLVTINRLLPYVTLRVAPTLPHMHLRDLANKGNNDILLRYSRLLQRQKGFKDLPGSRYLGTPDKLLFRYRYTLSDILSASLVAEKDAGEHFVNGSTGMDHLSGNLALFKQGIFKKVIVGDYSLQFGQGLTLWSGFAFGKGPDVTSVASKDVGLRPYSSSNEASFFRGVASTLSIARHFMFTPFISYRRLDASLKALPDSSFTLQNISISGLHRTKTELKNQRKLSQLVYGGVFQYQGNNLNLGLAGYQSGYQHKFVTGNQPYNKYGFTGKKLINTGFHYSYTFKNVYYYGEAAYSVNAGWAMVNGAMASLSTCLSAVLLYRSYDKDYHSFLSNGIGEGTEIANERGWYAGINYMPGKRWVFSAYGDYFHFPWLRYRVDAPSSGYEALGQIAFTQSKTMKAVLRYKREIKTQNTDTESDYNYLEDVKKESLRLECNWSFNKKFRFQQRSEITHYQKGKNTNEYGYLCYQDIDYHPMAAKISANMRFAYFNTSSYNSRIYAYEDDVLYGSSAGIYHGKGIRTFFNVRYRILPQTDLWARYAIYLYQNTETIGSGLDEITGSQKSDIKLQARYQF